MARKRWKRQKQKRVTVATKVDPTSRVMVIEATVKLIVRINLYIPAGEKNDEIIYYDLYIYDFNFSHLVPDSVHKRIKQAIRDKYGDEPIGTNDYQSGWPGCPAERRAERDKNKAQAAAERNPLKADGATRKRRG